MQRKTTIAGLSTLLIAASASADWHTVDMGRYAHGQVLSGETLGPATVRAVNFHHTDSRLVAFDTRERGTADPDLEGPNGDDFGQWTKGNIEPGEITGTVLILQQTGPSFAGYANTSETIVAQPDDEERTQDGKRPGAGEITFMLDHEVDAFRFTLFDVEQTDVFNEQTSSYVVFSGGDQHVKIAFADLVDPESQYYEPSITFGDHSANRFPPITAHELGLMGIDRVVINLGGSGAVGDLSYLEENHDIGAANFVKNSGFGSGSDSGSISGHAAEDSGTPGGGGGGGSPNPKPDPEDPDDEPEDPTGVPSPSAGIAGMLIMSLLAGRRPRRGRADRQSTS